MQDNPAKNLLDSISAEDLEKVRSYQSSTDGAYPVDNEWLLLAEFGKAFGWQAYLSVKNDEITAAEMLTLIEANRKLEAISHYRNAEASFIGAGSAQSKKPSRVFRSLTKDIINKAKITQ